MTIGIFPESIHRGYELHEWRHASAILGSDFPEELSDMVDVLERFRLCKNFITTPGGQKSQVSAWIDSELYRKGWREKKFDTAFIVDENPVESPTH
jgi:hypothetical protein